MIRNHDITLVEGERVLARPIRLSSGRSLPPVTGVDLAPGPAFDGGQMAAGVGLLIASIAALVVLWRQRSRTWRWAPAIGVAVGVFLAARALRGD